MAFGKKPGSQPESGRERRRHPRTLIRGPAELIIPTDLTVIPCRIIDVSLSGAQLSVPTVLGIPERLTLRLPTGQQIDVDVVRKSAGRLGVRYVRNHGG